MKINKRRCTGWKGGEMEGGRKEGLKEMPFRTHMW